MTGVDHHGTCVALGGRAVLLRGPSGAGKSDLAYRLVTERGGLLVADDRVCLSERAEGLIANARPGWAGRIELRGLGIVTLPSLVDAPLVMMVDLVDRDQVPRLAEPRFEQAGPVSLPVLRFHAFDVTTPAKIELAMAHIPGSGFPGDDGRLG